MMTDLTVFAHLVRVSGQVEQQFACHDVPHLERRVGAAAAQQATVGRPRHLVDTLHMTPQSRQEPATNHMSYFTVTLTKIKLKWSSDKLKWLPKNV